MSEQKKRILEKMFSYAVSQYFSQFVGFFTSIFMRRFLGPFNMGVWSLLKVISQYATYTHLGTTTTVFYKVPILRGQGDTEEVENVKNVVFSYISLTSFIAGLGITAYALIYRDKIGQSLFYGLLTLSALILLKRIYTYYLMLLRANKDFFVLSKSIVFDCLANLILVLILVKKFGLYGLYATIILIPVLNVLFIRRFVNYDLGFNWKFKKLLTYIKFGFPIYFNSMLAMILRSVDQIMIAKFLSIEMLGIYSVALLARNYGEGVSKNFNIVITPHFMEAHGKDGDIRKNSKYLKTPAILMSAFMIILLGLVYITAPLVISSFLPRFVSGILAMKILLLASFFYSASPQAHHFFVALNKQTRLVPIIGVITVLNVSLNFFAISKGYGIAGIAAATTISAFFSFFITHFYAMRHVETVKRTLLFMFYLMIPLIYSCILLIAIDHWNFENALAGVIVKNIIYLTACMPIIFVVNVRTGILKILFEMLRERFVKNEKEKV